MEDKNIWKIIDLCISINQKATQIYINFSEKEKIEELKAFWIEMADEEKIHTAFWNTAKEIAQEYMPSSIFHDPSATKEELETILQKIDILSTRWAENQTIENALILAYRLEYYILHPTFELLFHALKPLGTDPSEHYDRHIKRFIEMFIRYGDITPELELLGETLKSLWERNIALIEISMFDELTGLLNRRGFLMIAQELFYLAQRKNETIAVFMIDVDGFKQINDHHGHPRGDDVLKAVAESLKINVRKSDVLCRYGGDEFVILFPDIRSEAVSLMAEKIRKGVENVRPGGIPVTISIGVEQGSIQNESDTLIQKDLDALFFSWISKADQYLYDAKANGKNRITSGR